jgi:iron complex transport system permease protein
MSYQAGRWLLGTLEYASWYQVQRAGVALLVVSLLFAGNVLLLPLLGFSDSQNAAIGANPRLMGASLVGFGLVLVSIGVWATGPLTLLAFFAPQVAQRLARTPTPPLYLAGLAGSATLVCADVVSRVILVDSGVPVGSVVVVLGGTYLLWLLLTRPRHFIG